MPRPRTSRKYTYAGSSARSRNRRSSRNSPARRPSASTSSGDILGQRDGPFQRLDRLGQRERRSSPTAARCCRLTRTRLSMPPTPGTFDRTHLPSAAEERPRVVRDPCPRPSAHGLRVIPVGHRASPPSARSHVAHQVLDAVVADRQAEVLRRHVLELVRLVDHRVAAVGDHLAEGVLPHRRVGAEQVVVDDDDVGLGGALAHPRDEAVVVAAGTRCRGSSRLVAATSLQNGRSSGRSSSSARSPVSVSRRQSSIDRQDRSSSIEPRTRQVTLAVGAGAVAERLEAVQAQVVAAPLHAGRRERDVERLAQDRDVLEVDLFLEVLGAGRDQHPLAAEDGGHEVGERLAGAGARLGQQDAAVVEARPPRPPPSRAGRGAARSRAAPRRADRRARTPPRRPAARRRRAFRSPIRLVRRPSGSPTV